MTNKEKEMFEIIKENPQITQSELAQILSITRSSVSVHISNIIKKGYISGRGYVINEPRYVTVIGAANIDIIGRSSERLILEDSNPGKVEFCAGGVGRNIAENLARLSVNTKIISSLGDDNFGNMLLDFTKPTGVDMNYCYVQKGGTTSTYLAVLENDGEMKVAISDMALLDKMPIEHLARHHHIIKNSQLLVIDTGLPEKTLEYIVANFSSSDLFLDTVSIGKAKHVKRLIGAFHTVKMNRYEAEFLSDVHINSDNLESLKEAGRVFLAKGIKRVFISLGRRGVFYMDKDEVLTYKPPYVKPINATGAGDAFMAGMVYSYLNEKDNNFTIKFSSAMSRLSLLSKSTVSPFISVEKILSEMEKI